MKQKWDEDIFSFLSFGLLKICVNQLSVLPPPSFLSQADFYSPCLSLTVVIFPLTKANTLYNTLMSLVTHPHVFLTCSLTWLPDVTLCAWIWISSEKDWCITWGSSQTKFMPLMCLVCMKARPAGVTHPAVPTIRDCTAPSSCIAVASSYTCNLSGSMFIKAAWGALILNCFVIFWNKLKKETKYLYCTISFVYWFHFHLWMEKLSTFKLEYATRNM